MDIGYAIIVFALVSIVVFVVYKAFDLWLISPTQPSIGGGKKNIQ